uniref:PH domain-containing protein n=1 Tax=Seriola lalandi dorsalis TaxID=1841481 RepID=A0A3B4X4F2_SERLL
MVLGELSRVSRPCSPLDQEKALKAGWLKRQRSIMKNWQLRWFVLRTEALHLSVHHHYLPLLGRCPEPRVLRTL